MPITRRWLTVEGRDVYALLWGPKETTTPERTVLILADCDFFEYEDLNDRMQVIDEVVAYATKSSLSDLPTSVGVLVACPDTPPRDSSAQIEAINLLNRLNPDVLLVACKRFASALWGSHRAADGSIIQHYLKHFGYIEQCTFQAQDVQGQTIGYRIPACYTPWLAEWTDPNPAIKGDEGGGVVNLLGYVVKHLQTAMRGYNRYSISVPPVEQLQIITIDTIPAFEGFMRWLWQCRTPVIDYETKNLCKLANQLLTLQWLLPNDEGRYWLFFIPWAHRETPFTPDELEYMRQCMAHWWEFGQTDYVITHGGKFDLCQSLGQLRVRWINHLVFDTQAGEYALDENRKFMQLLGYKRGDGPYALANLEPEYGYRRPGNVMDKSERGSMADQPLEVIRPYGMIDVVTPWEIHLCQRAEAARRGYHNYLTFVTDQLGKTLLVMAGMEHTGCPADAGYLQEQTMPNSRINKTIDDALAQMRQYPSVQKMNAQLIAGLNLPKTGWDGKPIANAWRLELNKPAVQQELCFKVLGLEPVSWSKKEGIPSVDGRFFETYSNVPEVKTLGEWKAMSTIKQTFSDALHERLISDPDSLTDGRIHPSYDYKTVLTGRSSSFDPNLQNQPSQGDLAELIERIWIALMGKVTVKADYRAHEIRGLGNIAGDTAIQKTFALADEAVLRMRTAEVGHNASIEDYWTISKRLGDKSKKPDALNLEEAVQALKDCNLDGIAEAFRFFVENSDVHIINVKFFFKVTVDKKHRLRYQIKAVVFATIYGQGARSLSIDLTEKGNPTTEDEAQGLMTKLFQNWQRSGQWIAETHKQGKEHLVVFNQIGAARHMWGYLHPSFKMQGAMNRRGPNSLIQGFSGYTAYQASWQTAQEVWRTFTSRGLDLGMAQINSVHDSNVNECWFAAIPIAVYLIEHGMKGLTMNHYHQTYGANFTVPYDVDFAFGINDRDKIEWGDQRFDSLARHITKLYEQSVERQRTLLGPHGQIPPRSQSVACETAGRLLGPGDLSNALHNLDRIAGVRLHELRNHPFHMSLQGNTDWYVANMRGL